MSSQKSAATKDAHKHRNAGRKSQIKAKPDEREEILKQVCQWVAEGKTLRDFCRQPDMPCYATVYNWLNQDEELLKMFTLAREIGADVIAEEALNILDTFPMATANGSMDSAHVSWLKNRFEGRLKLLAKWFPQRYGDKVSMQHEGGVTLNVVTGVSDDD